MYKTLKTTKIFDHPRIGLLEDDIEYQDGTKSTYLKFEHRANAAQTIGIRDDGKILMINEYSHGVGETLLMFPGGLIGLDEDKKLGAIREFAEETGLEPTRLQEIGMIYPYHRRLAEKLFLFVGHDLKESKIPSDQSEMGIKIVWHSPQEITDLIKAGKITNSHTLAHWAIYKNL